MEVKFYINPSPTMKIDKNLTLVKTVNVDIPNNINVVNPIFIVDKTSIPSVVNYCICGSPLNRSYFIVAMDFTNAKRTVIAAHVDVLSTYKELIQNTVLNYVGGAAEINEIEDGSYPLGDCLKVENYPLENWNNSFFTNSDSGNRYLLRIADGAARKTPLTPQVQLGAQILYKNLVFTVEGSNVLSAYLSDPTEIPLPPSQSYTTVANGGFVNVYMESGDVRESAKYRFFETTNTVTQSHDYIFELQNN